MRYIFVRRKIFKIFILIINRFSKKGGYTFRLHTRTYMCVRVCVSVYTKRDINKYMVYIEDERRFYIL